MKCACKCGGWVLRETDVLTLERKRGIERKERQIGVLTFEMAGLILDP